MAVAVDASTQATFTENNTANVAITSAAFSPPANTLILVAFADENTAASNADSTASITNTGTALTWTQVALANRTTTTTTNSAATMFFWALNTAAQTSITATVTPTFSSSADRQVNVAVLTGHDTTAPVGASGVGISGVAATAIAYTATVVGSMGFAVAWQGFSGKTVAAGTGTSLIANLVSAATTNQTHARMTATAATLVTQTINLTYSGATTAAYSYIEILPAAAVVQAEGAYNSSAMTWMGR